MDGAAGVTGAGAAGALAAGALVAGALDAGTPAALTGGFGAGWRRAGSPELATGALIRGVTVCVTLVGTGPAALLVPVGAVVLPIANAAPNSTSTASKATPI